MGQLTTAVAGRRANVYVLSRPAASLYPAHHVPSMPSTSKRCHAVAAGVLQSTTFIDSLLDNLFALLKQGQQAPSKAVPPAATTVQSCAEIGWRTDFSETFLLGENLGRGAFGQVQLAVDTGGREFAVKTMRKVRGLATREASLRKIKREARLMRMAQSCQGVVQLVDCFEEAEFVHLVTEVCRGGDLKKHVEAHGPLSERMLAHTACEVLKIVRDMHALGIVYADVKPANFCLADEWVESASGDSVADSAAGEVGWRIKAIDFGCSQLFGPEAGRSPRLSKRTGTLAFMAPEIFDHDFSAKADVWSTGVSLYWLFTGRLPYWGEGEVPNLSRVDDMAALARGAPMALDYGPWLSMSEEGTSFITGCLTRSESDRLDVDAALAHPWIAKWVSEPRQSAEPGTVPPVSVVAAPR